MGKNAKHDRPVVQLLSSDWTVAVWGRGLVNSQLLYFFFYLFFDSALVYKPAQKHPLLLLLLIFDFLQSCVQSCTEGWPLDMDTDMSIIYLAQAYISHIGSVEKPLE